MQSSKIKMSIFLLLQRDWCCILTPRWQHGTHSPNSHVFDVCWRRHRHVPGLVLASWQSTPTVYWWQTMKQQLTNTISTDQF